MNSDIAQLAESTGFFLNIIYKLYRSTTTITCGVYGNNLNTTARSIVVQCSVGQMNQLQVMGLREIPK